MTQEAILERLRKRYEAAQREFCSGGHIDLLGLSKSLSESILEALDAGLNYPTPTVCKWIEIERGDKGGPQS